MARTSREKDSLAKLPHFIYLQLFPTHWLWLLLYFPHSISSYGFPMLDTRILKFTPPFPFK